MSSRLIPGLVALVPVLACASADSVEDSGNAADVLRGWSVERLCAARADPEAWAEIERRELFHGRELRAIARERVREGLREQAVRCFMGWPDSVVASVSAVGNDPVDAWIYPAGENGTLVVYLRRMEEESAVLAFLETDDATGSAPAVSLRLSCKQSAGRVSCDVIEQDGDLNWGLHGPGTDRFGFPQGLRRSDALAPPGPNMGSGTGTSSLP
jgi:hypothetical protein